MKICVISRPPLKEMTKKFHQRRYHIFKRIELMGHHVESFVIHPLRIPNLYLAYGLGLVISPFRCRKIRPDVVVADDLESSVAAVFIKSLYNVPFVFDFIDDYTLIARYDGRMTRYQILKFMERKIPVHADLIIVATPQIRKYCLDLGIPGRKLRLIPNGVDTERFRPGLDTDAIRKKLNLQGKKVILFVGKINRYYHLKVILKAIPDVLENFPETKFLFVGDGDSLHSLKELSHKLKVDAAVMFTGFLPSEEIPTIVNLSQICVFSLPNDGALAIFEYMSCAKPLVLPQGGTRKMGISRRIIPDSCALMVENSPEGFAQGIQHLLRNEDIGEEMGRTARERVVRFHDWSMLAEKYERALREILPSSRKGL